MYRVILAIIVTMLFAWAVHGEAPLQSEYEETLTLGARRAAQYDSADFYFPRKSSLGRPQLVGLVTLVMKMDCLYPADTTKYGGRTDSLSVYARTLHLIDGVYYENRLDSVVLMNKYDFGNGAVYAPVVGWSRSGEMWTPWAQGWGLRIYADWRALVLEDSVGNARDSLTITAIMVTQ